jgi:hypothetical protein
VVETREDARCSSTASVVGTSGETLPSSDGTLLGLAAPGVAVWLFQAAECAGEEDERVVDARDAQVVDPPYDDPVIAGGVLGDDLALEAWRGRR